MVMDGPPLLPRSILCTKLAQEGNMEVHTIGMELGKPAFHLVGAM